MFSAPSGGEEFHGSRHTLLLKKTHIVPAHVKEVRVALVHVQKGWWVDVNGLNVCFFVGLTFGKVDGKKRTFGSLLLKVSLTRDRGVTARQFLTQSHFKRNTMGGKAAGSRVRRGAISVLINIRYYCNQRLASQVPAISLTFVSHSLHDANGILRASLLHQHSQLNIIMFPIATTWISIFVCSSVA